MLKYLFLDSFRSHLHRSITFHPQTTIIVGHNAIGKTNILEAVYLLGVGKSFRTQQDEEMVHFGREIARVEARTEDDYLEVYLSKGWYQTKKIAKKKFKINHAAKRRKDILGRLKVVLFEPEDIEIMIGSPSKRRLFLDFALLQTHPEYATALAQYQKGMRHRNRLLGQIAEGVASIDQLAYWDELLINHAHILHHYRQQFVDFISDLMCQPTYSHILRALSVKSNPEIQFRYQPKFITLERLAKYRQVELATKKTLIGPHRDDFAVFQSQTSYDDRNLASFGSRGEQRMSTLALKIGELEYLSHFTQERPILLLDDIFSELDDYHRDVVFAFAKKQQTVITTTDIKYLSSKVMNQVKVVELGS